MSGTERRSDTKSAEDKTIQGTKAETSFEIQHHAFGIQEIVKINAIAEVKEAELESGSREDRQREIAFALKKPIRIFPDDKPSTDTYLPLPQWFKRSRCLSLFPPMLDSELIAEDDARFGKTDSDVRALVEKISDLFSLNINAYLSCKRELLRRTLRAVGALSAVLIVMFILLRETQWLSPSPSITAIVLVIAMLLLIAVTMGMLYWFRHDIRDVYATVYLAALKGTAYKTSEFLSGRMNALSNRFEEYVGKIDSLLPKGEKVEGVDPNKRDNSYKGSNVFLWTQMLMWLPARVERIESLLRYKMALMTAAHAEADYRSFRAIRRMCAVYAILPAVALLEGLVALVHPWRADLSANTVLMSGMQVLIAGLTLAYIIGVGRLAYGKKEWNTPKYVFKDYLDTELWFGSQKYNLGTRIPARVGKAFDEIDHKDRQVGHIQG